jgi:hypothetical protein
MYGEKKGTLDEMMMMYLFVLDQHVYLYFNRLCWNSSPRVDVSLHLDTLSLFRTKQAWLLLFNAEYLAEKQLEQATFNDDGFDSRSGKAKLVFAASQLSTQH